MLSSRFLVLKSKPSFHQLKQLSPISSRSISVSQSNLSTSSQTKVNANNSKNVINSPFPDLPSVKGLLIQELIRSEGQKWGNQIALECSATGLKYTHNDVYKLGRNFGAALLKAGLKRGDVAAILLPNCPQYLPVVNGMLETGIIPSLVNPLHTPAELGGMLVHTEAKCIVTIPLLFPLIQAVTNNLPPAAKSAIKLTVCVPFGGTDIPEGSHSYEDMIKTDASSAESGFLQGSMSHVNTSTDTALLLWSSGTSGPPKAVMLTHENVCVQLRQVLSVTDYKRGQETFLGLAPFFHVIGALGNLCLAPASGAKVVTLPKFDPALFTQTLKTHKFTTMHVVPPLVGFLVANPAITKEDLSSLHTVACGAAPTGLHIIRALFAKFGDQVNFQEAFGLTESTGLCHVNPMDGCNTRVGTVGCVMPGSKSKIEDINTGEALGPGQNGEICLHGLQVVKGYFKNEEATRNTIDAEGWLHTGDIGYYNEQGLFYVVGRLKELIKVKGFQVSPTELEDVLRAHPKIVDTAVIGIPDERDGELPRAYIVPKDSNLGEKEIHEYLQDKLAAYKQLKGGVEFVKEIPKSPAGKILRRVLLASYTTNNATATK